jgi:tight adherence protein B
MRGDGAHEAVGAGETLVQRRRAATTVVSRLLTRGERAERTALMLHRAGSGLSPGEFALLRIILASVAFTGVYAFTPGSVLPTLAGALAVFVAYMAPRAWMARKTSKRRDRLQLQYIEMVSLVSSAVRSGFALLQALDTAARRVGPPLADDLDRLLTDVRLGRPMDECLRDWLARAGDRDLQLIVTAILVQRHSGGNLAEVLDNLGQTMRERIEVRQQIRSVTAYGRLVSRIVSGYPLAIALLLTAMQSHIWGALWTTPAGWALLTACGVLNALAFFVLRKVVQVDY